MKTCKNLFQGRHS